MRKAAALLMASFVSLASPLAAKEKSPPPQPSEEPNWSAVRSQVERYIQSTLVDPDSAKIRWTRGFSWGFLKPPLMAKIWGWIGCASVNARNQMGGYTGPQATMIIWRNGVVFSDSDASYMFAPTATRCERVGLPTVQAEFAVTPHETLANSSVADELGKLVALRDRGVISDREFQMQKARLLQE